MAIEFHVVSHVQNERCLSNEGGVDQTGPNGVDAPLERPETVPGPRVVRKLAIDVPNWANHESRRKFESSRPLEMKFVATLIVGRRILNIEGEPRSSIELQLFCAVGPGEGPARINPRSIVTSDWREALLPMACRSHSLHVDEMREAAVLPSKLKPRYDIAYAV